MKRIPTLFLQAVTVLAGIGALAFMVWEPQTEGVNAHATLFAIYFKDPFITYAYIGSIPLFIALINIFKVLGYARNGTIFSQKSLSSLRAITYSSLALIGFVAVGEIFIMLNASDDRAGGVFIGILIAFGAAVISAGATSILYARK